MTTCPCQHNKYGYTLNEGVLMKQVEGSKHKLRTPPGWAIQAAVIEQHLAELTEVRIHDLDDGKLYRVSKEHLLRFCREIDRGHGKQLFLHMDYWIVKWPDNQGPGLQMRLF